MVLYSASDQMRMEHCSQAICDSDVLQHGEIFTIMDINSVPSVYVNEMDVVHSSHENLLGVEGSDDVV